jgi:glutamate synthase domain-containing protein 2
MSIWWLILAVIVTGLVAIAVYDLSQHEHAILRNFPVIGHFRYLLEGVGPELRQYIVTDNNEERPFNRDQRKWVYATAKGDNTYFGFGTDNDLELAQNYLVIRQSEFPVTAPWDPLDRIPCAKVLGGARGRPLAFRPDSVVNVSAMSFGSLSAPAIEALDRGAAAAGCLHNTGEGGVSESHLHGASLILQVGTGYFGCRDEHGRFDLDRLAATVEQAPVRAIEIKLSQGAKPGLGGVLPAIKVTPEIAAARDVDVGKDCVSPPGHSAFHDADSRLDFVELIATRTGLPVGIKSAVGDAAFWRELASSMATTGRGVDFVTIDGGEGGTGAAPLVFTDHVALPFSMAMATVYREFALAGLTDDVVFIGSAKLGFPDTALFAFALGCDMVNVAREAMLALGCIQAQRCHTGRCPTGIATQSPRLARGLDPIHKGDRVAKYLCGLRHELLLLSHACGVVHPGLVTAEQIEILDGHFHGQSAASLFGYETGWGLPAEADRRAITELMAHLVPG